MLTSTQEDHRRVVVVGSINADVIVGVGHLPRVGETVKGTARIGALGGKGANQAVAVARTGVAVSMVGAVGSDAEGRRMLARLSNAGVEVGSIATIADCSTGRAYVWVGDEGDNMIVVVPGANDRVTAGTVAGAAKAVAAADVLVVQGEIPAEAIQAALEVAQQAGKRVIVNLAPFSNLGAAVSEADPLVVNEVEAAQLLGREVAIMNDEIAREVSHHAKSAVITLGADGALVVRGGEVRHVQAPQAGAVVDTTGAGDAFVGVLAAALASQRDLFEATVVAVHAATASISVDGAGDRYPTFSLSLSAEATSWGSCHS